MGSGGILPAGLMPSKSPKRRKLCCLMMNSHACFGSVFGCQSGVALCCSVYSGIPTPEPGNLYPVFTQQLALPSLPYSTHRALYMDFPSLLLWVFPCIPLPTPQILHEPWRDGDTDRNHSKDPSELWGFLMVFCGMSEREPGSGGVLGDLS